MSEFATARETFMLQWAIYHCAYSGDLAETSALIAEIGYTHSRPHWDGNRRSLSTQTVNGEPVPDWWALPHLPMTWREEAMAQGSLL